MNDIVPDRSVSPNCIINEKATATIGVENNPRSVHQSVRTEELQIEVLGTIAIKPKPWVCSITAAVGRDKSKFQNFINLVQSFRNN